MEKNRCHLCSKTFTVRHNLLRHLRNIHGIQHVHSCPLCEKTFSRPDNLKKHVKECEVKNSPQVEQENVPIPSTSTYPPPSPYYNQSPYSHYSLLILSHDIYQIPD